MEEGKKIIIDIEVDKKNATKNFLETEKAIRSLKEEQKKLNEEIKKSGQATDDQLKDAVRLEVELKKLSEQRRQAVNDIKNNANSIQALRNEIGKLTTEYNNLDTSTAEGSKRFFELQGRLKELNDQLKDVTTSSGNFKENIGNYKASVVSALESTNVFGFSIGSLNNVFKTAKLGIVEFTGSLNLLKTALIATGIGAIVILLGSFVAFINQSQSGADKFAQVLAKLQKAIEPAISLLVSLGEQVFSVFEDLADVFASTFEALLPLIKATFVPLQALVFVIKGVSSAVVGFFNSFGIRSSKAVNDTALLVKGLQDVERQLKAQEVTNAQSLATQEKLKNIRDDERKSNPERLKANKELGLLIEKQLSQNLKLENEKLRLLQKQLEDKPKELRTNEDIAKVQEQQKKIAEVIADIEGKRNEQITNTVSLLKEGFEFSQRQFSAELRLAKAKDKNFEFSKKSLEAETKLIAQRAKAELKNVQDANVRKSIELEAQAEIFEVTKDFNEKVKARNKELLDKQIENTQKLLDKQLFNLQTLALAQKENTEARVTLDKRILEVQAQKEIADAKNNAEQIRFIRAKLAKDIKDLEKNAQDERNKQSLQNEISLQNVILNTVEQTSEEAFKARREIAKKNFDLALIEAKDNQAKQKEAESVFQKELNQIAKEQGILRLKEQIALQENLNLVAKKGSTDQFNAQQELVKLRAELSKVEVENLAERAVIDNQALNENLENEKAYRENLNALIAQYGFERVKLENEQGLARAFTKQELDTFEINSEAQKVRAFGQIGQAFGSIFGQQSAIAKITASANAGINSFLAFTQALADPLIPVFAKPFVAGSILASGLDAQAQILGLGGGGETEALTAGLGTIGAGLTSLAPPLPIPQTEPVPLKLNSGGLVSGAGTSKSDSIPAMLSNGESVINAKSTKMFAPILSSINTAGGGKPFKNGGIATNSSIQKIASTFDTNTQISNAIKNAPAPIVSVVDIQNVSNKVTIREQSSSL